jgi:hypothetical protein
MITDNDFEFKPISGFPIQWNVVFEDKVVARVTERIVTNVGYVTERMCNDQAIEEVKFDDRDAVMNKIIEWCTEDQTNVSSV